jgi:CheY-like chemotaxis protein
LPNEDFMSSQRPTRNVLIIGVDAETFGKVAPMFDRSDVDVDRFPRGRSSLELLSVVAFDTLLVGYPLPDMSMGEFLSDVRREDALTRQTPILIMTADEKVEEANQFIGRGANRVVPLSIDAESLQSVVSGLLEVAPRVGARVMAQLEVQLEEGKTLAMCQTENISSTGMLIRTYVGYPIGTKLRFEFPLPDSPRLVRGEAVVVRHTLQNRERISGVGARFVSFEGDGERRFQKYLEGVVAETSSEASHV